MTLTFWQMLSHFFPGLLVAISFFLYIDVVSKKDLLLSAFQNTQTLIAAMSIFLIIGTILGVIVDSIHHRVVIPFFKHISQKRSNPISLYNDQGKEVRDTYFISLLGVDNFNRVFEAYYYYSEAYINFAIALIPSTISFLLYAYEFLSFKCSQILILVIISLIFQCFLYWSGYITWMNHHVALRNAIDGARDFHKKQPPNPNT